MKTIHMVALALVLALLPAQAQATSISAGIVGGGGVANIYDDRGNPLIINQGTNPLAPGGAEGAMYVTDGKGNTIVNNVGPGMNSAISITTPTGTLNAFNVPDPSNPPDSLVGTQLLADLTAIANGEVMTNIPRGEDNYGFDFYVQSENVVSQTTDGTVQTTTGGQVVTSTQTSGVDWASYFDPNSDYSSSIDSGGSGLTLSQRKFLSEGDEVPDGGEAYALKMSDPSSRKINPNLRVARVGSSEYAERAREEAQKAWMEEAIQEGEDGYGVSIGEGKA